MSLCGITLFALSQRDLHKGYRSVSWADRLWASNYLTAPFTSALELAGYFDAKSYFTTTMDPATTHLQADELRNGFLALPAERTAVPNSLVRAFLSKLPDSIAMPRALLEDKLIESEILGTQVPWTSYEQLVGLVAQHILIGARRAGTMSAHIFSDRMQTA